MPPLSSKFGDMYPVTGYEENSVAVNGLHGDINGEGGNVALKAGVSSVLWCLYFKKMPKNFPPEFLDDESDIHYEWATSKSGNVMCTVLHPFPNLVFVFTRFCFSLLTLPAAVVHQRVMRRKLMVRLVGSPLGSRKRIPQERPTVFHPLTTTNR